MPIKLLLGRSTVWTLTILFGISDNAEKVSLLKTTFESDSEIQWSIMNQKGNRCYYPMELPIYAFWVSHPAAPCRKYGHLEDFKEVILTGKLVASIMQRTALQK